ncbi:MAG: cupin domain-containing protein [Flavitalea sp.]
MHRNVSRRYMLQSAIAMVAAATVKGVSAMPVNTSDPEPVLIPPGAGKKARIGDSDIIFKLTSEQTSGNIGSVESVIPSGKLGAPPHYHRDFDEICIVLEGSLQILVENKIYQADAGAWHLRPRGKVHTFWNNSKDPAKVIEIYSPAGHEKYMNELSDLFINKHRPSPKELQGLADRFDIHFRFDLLEKIIKEQNVTL